MLRIEPDIWIKLRTLAAPKQLDKRIFFALRDQARILSEAGFVIVSGNEKDWTGTFPQPRDWLNLPYETIADAKFEVVGVLIRRYSLRIGARDNPYLVGLPIRVELLTDAVANLLEAGIAIGGGREGVEVLFPTVESFSAWAAEGEIPRRFSPAPFCPYPRQKNGD